MPSIGTCFKFYTEMRVDQKNKAFAYRSYSHFTQQCTDAEHDDIFQPKPTSDLFCSIGMLHDNVF